jgi:hypothetical protein
MNIYKGNPNQEETKGKFFVNAFRSGSPWEQGQFYRGWCDEYAYCYEETGFLSEAAEALWKGAPHMFLDEYEPNWWQRHFDKRFRGV